MALITISAITSSTIPRDGLNFWFDAQNHPNLPNNNTATDRSGNYRDFTLLNNSTKVSYSDDFSGSFNFNGTTDNYIKTPIDRTITSNTITMILWFRRNTIPVAYAGLFYNRTTGATAGLHFGGSGNTTKLRYTWNNNHYDVETSLVTAIDVWTFCALSVRSNGATFTMISATGSKSTFSHTSVTNNALSFTSSFLGWDGFSTRYLNGRISQAFFYTRDLSDSEVQAIYNHTLYRNYPLGYSLPPTTTTTSTTTAFSGYYLYTDLNQGDCSSGGTIEAYGIRSTFGGLQDGDYLYTDTGINPLQGYSSIGDTLVYFSIDPDSGKILDSGTLCQLPE
jgi:hypothetical protein